MKSLVASPQAFLVCVVALALACAEASHAAPQEGVPQFAVRTLGGQEVSSDSLLRSEPWVLAYVDSGAASRDLLAAITRRGALPDRPRNGGGIVVIVRGDPAAAGQLAGVLDKTGAAARGFAPSHWYADPAGHAARAMGVKGAPALLGVDERNIIRWRMDGPLLKPVEVRALIERWVNR